MGCSHHCSGPTSNRFQSPLHAAPHKGDRLAHHKNSRSRNSQVLQLLLASLARHSSVATSCAIHHRKSLRFPRTTTGGSYCQERTGCCCHCQADTAATFSLKNH